MNTRREGPLPGSLSEKIADRAAQMNLSITDLKKMGDVSYEHARKLVAGTSAIQLSFPVLKKLCKGLNLDFKECSDLLTREQVIKSFGIQVVEVFGENPELEPIQAVWGSLTVSQKKDAITLIQDWAKRSNMKQSA